MQNHGVLYPPNWLMFVLPIPLAMRVVMLEHYALAMGGACWCARVFGVGRAAALLAGVAYACSGSLAAVGINTTPAILASVCWLPWQFGLTRKVMAANGRWQRYAVALGLSVAVSFIGGHPQQLMYGLQLCAAYALAHMANTAIRSGARVAGALVPRLAVAGAVAVGVAVVLNDAFDPYWVATVDGRPAPIVRANYVFRGVPVDAGEHAVRFVYRPTLSMPVRW